MAGNPSKTINKLNETHPGSESNLPKRKFFIFGHNISHSLSPHLHNAGFKALGLPYHYRIHESENVDKSVETLIHLPDFGGASVTFPHKLQVGRLLNKISPQATQIGAVNTIIIRDTKDGRILTGDNTDWLGIKACIERSGVAGLETSSGMVLGAGGAARAACYAMQALGIKKITLVNRTRSKAEQMAAAFPAVQFQVFDTLDHMCSAGDTPRVVVACVPADDLGEDKIPPSVFSGVKEGVLVEMAYRPPVTGMMVVAGRYPGWRVFTGMDILEEQAFAQFSLWTGLKAPAEAMHRGMVTAINARL